jgi:hypothetical protein
MAHDVAVSSSSWTATRGNAKGVTCEIVSQPAAWPLSDDPALTSHRATGVPARTGHSGTSSTSSQAGRQVNVEDRAYAEEMGPRVSVPKQGGFQACRVSLMWFTLPSPGGNLGQLPRTPVLAARAGDLSAVSAALAAGTAGRSGWRPRPGGSSAGTGLHIWV